MSQRYPIHKTDPPQPLLLPTSILKCRFLHGPLRAHKLQHCMQHCKGLCVFLGNVYLDFHRIPGGINDLKKVKSTSSSGRKRSKNDWTRPGHPCHPWFSCHGHTTVPCPLKFCPYPRICLHPGRQKGCESQVRRMSPVLMFPHLRAKEHFGIALFPGVTSQLHFTVLCDAVLPEPALGTPEK